MLKFFQSDMQSTASSLFSAYASFTALMMMIKSMSNDVVPEFVRSYFQSWFNYIITPIPSSTTIVIDDTCGMSRNEIYDAAEIYLRTKISPTAERFKANKTARQKKIQLSIEKNEEIHDTFREIRLLWKFVSVDPDQNGGRRSADRYFELTFNKKHRDRVVDEYLPHVLAKAKEIKDKDKVVKLYTTDRYSYDDEDSDGSWGSINLEHPATFEKLAMDPAMKKAVIDDLERFVRRRDYYKKVGKAWKRGYLLYGPPGTGKSSLIAAMANYLHFDIYDLELASLYSNSELRRILVSTKNKSIIVIEDIDCSPQMHDRGLDDDDGSSDSGRNTKLTLSGLLNFIDGLWSSCGDERIIIFTTNHKDKLDPALLRPGRMDMHIHMSYCTFEGFKLLASNYLEVVEEHRLYGEIKELLGTVNVTPAEIAEELMKNEDADIALSGLVEFMKGKGKEVEERKEKEKDKKAGKEEKLEEEEKESDIPADNESEIEEEETENMKISQVEAVLELVRIARQDGLRRRLRVSNSAKGRGGDGRCQGDRVKNKNEGKKKNRS